MLMHSSTRSPPLSGAVLFCMNSSDLVSSLILDPLNNSNTETLQDLITRVPSKL